MKLETGNFCRVTRGELKTGNSRSGIALIITLTIMALLLILGTAFVVNMRSERQVSFNYRRQVEARQAALAGLHTAIGKMNTFYAYADSVNASVQTMGGRFYYSTGNIGTTKKTIASGVSQADVPWTTNMLMFSCVVPTSLYTTNPDGTISTNLANKVNMNMGSYNFTAPLNPGQQQSDYYLPIANPSVHTSRKWNAEKVGVWAGNLTVGSATFAFWIDDESSKINISSAGTRNLAPLGHDNGYLFSDIASKVGYYPVVTPPPPYAAIFQSSTKQISSVDLAVLDNKVVNTAETAFPSQQNWSDPSTLTSIETARGAGIWPAFQSPDEVLGIPSNLTMQDYQAVKPCLTAWSVENEDRAQMFRTNTLVSGSYPMVSRYNVGKMIENPVEATKLYNFLITQCDLANSVSLRKFFTNATFKLKYPGTVQPFTNGCVNQIAANIISYVTDPEKPNNPPYGAGVSGLPNLPTGYCGLWKACYMNEIAFGFCWQRIPPVAPSTIPKFQLWAAMYVELINPYEIDLPRTGKSENYTIDLDPDGGASPLAFNVTWPVGSTVPAAPAMPGGGALYSCSVQNPIKAHSYSSTSNPINADVSPVPWVQWQWPISGIITTNTPPAFTQIEITMPKAIRMTMNNGKSSGIIDWFNRDQTVPTLAKLTLPTGSYNPHQVVVAGPQFLPLTFTPGPAQADFAYWDRNNPTRISIAKNDPRVHQWYGQRSGASTKGITGPGNYTAYGVTLKVPDASLAVPGWGDNNGQNPIGNINVDGSGGIVDFRGGDTEIQNGTYAANATKPEFRSNFVIAEGGMRSIGELGFIHTGKPWRSLSLQPYGVQVDERLPNSTSRKPPGDQTAIPDWVILDLFTVNTPPIYGRVNINNGGWHLGNYTAGTYIGNTNPSFEDPLTPPLRPNLLADWKDAITQWYGGVGGQWPFYTLRTSAYNRFAFAVLSNATSGGYRHYQNDAASLPLAAALNVIPQYQFRNMLANFITHRATNMISNLPQIMDPYQPFVSVAQICEIPCMTNHFASLGLAINVNPATNPLACTDADREDTVRRIINVLTTHGDAFTVHVVGTQDAGEARLVAVVERTYDPKPTQFIDRNRFRIRQIRWITD